MSSKMFKWIYPYIPTEPMNLSTNIEEHMMIKPFTDREIGVQSGLLSHFPNNHKN